jgi:hypothetical protein
MSYRSSAGALYTRVMSRYSSEDWGRTLAHLTGGALDEFPADEIFLQTPRGAALAARNLGEIPDRLRMLLLLVNGRRTVAEYRDLLPRFRSLDEAFDMLLKMGFVERLPRSLDL